MVDPTKDASSGVNVPYVEVNFYTPPTQANPNGALVPVTGNRNAPGNIVEVSVKNFPYALMAPFSGSLSSVTGTAFYASPGSQLRIQVFSADVLGGAPTGGPPAP